MMNLAEFNAALDAAAQEAEAKHDEIWAEYDRQRRELEAEYNAYVLEHNLPADVA